MAVKILSSEGRATIAASIWPSQSQADDDVIGSVAPLEVQGAVDGIEDDRVGRDIAGKALFERRALFGDTAHKREVLQHSREEDVLHSRVEGP